MGEPSGRQNPRGSWQQTNGLAYQRLSWALQNGLHLVSIFARNRHAEVRTLSGKGRASRTIWFNWNIQASQHRKAPLGSTFAIVEIVTKRCRICVSFTHARYLSSVCECSCNCRRVEASFNLKESFQIIKHSIGKCCPRWCWASNQRQSKCNWRRYRRGHHGSRGYLTIAKFCARCYCRQRGSLKCRRCGSEHWHIAPWRIRLGRRRQTHTKRRDLRRNLHTCYWINTLKITNFLS